MNTASSQKVAAAPFIEEVIDELQEALESDCRISFRTMHRRQHRTNLSPGGHKTLQF